MTTIHPLITPGDRFTWTVDGTVEHYMALSHLEQEDHRTPDGELVVDSYCLYAREILPGGEEGTDYQLHVLPDEIADITITRSAAA